MKKSYLKIASNNISPIANLARAIDNAYFLKNSWEILYEVMPPSVENFLTPLYLGAVADQIYPHVRQTLIEFFDPTNNKRLLALASCISWGKSLCSTLAAVYVIILLSYLRDPKEFFGLNVAGSLVISLLSFTKEKTNQILLQPFYTVLRCSPIFERTIREDRLQFKQQEIEIGHVAYTSAGRMGSFQFAKDIHIIVQSDRAALLGLNIVFGIASEISFWIKKGISVDEIWGTFNDLRERVNSRFADRLLSGVVLDSSPLDLNLSPIDKWLWSGEAEKDKRVMIVKASHWDVFPEKYPEWRASGKTFKVFRGSAAKPPKIVKGAEINNYSKDDIVSVPIDKLQSFKNDIKKQVADYVGYPSGGLSKLFDDITDIENIFNPNLENVYSYITASANENPEDLIWNKLKGMFFIDVAGKYVFYRAPNAPRTIHIDLAESADLASIAMSHLEQDVDGKTIAVVDFTIPISPERSRINLDAISDFIIALKRKGKLKIKLVTSDQYQSSTILQRLTREGFEAKLFSVDKDVAPYRVVVSWILNKRVKVGRNVILKNNFLSLIELRTATGKKKIDHSKGRVVYDDGANWENSNMGINAKDVSDAMVGSVHNAISLFGDKIPAYQYLDAEYSEKVLLEKLMKDFRIVPKEDVCTRNLLAMSERV